MGLARWRSSARPTREADNLALAGAVYGRGVDGLLHDATRPGRKKPLPSTTIERVVAMTLTDPPGEATHWTRRAMAKAAGISLRSVQRIWTAHTLHLHRVRQRSARAEAESMSALPVFTSEHDG